MILTDEDKVQIVRSGLEERYKSLHEIRARIQGVCVWALGLLLGAAGWLLQTEINLTHLQKTAVVVAVGVSFVSLRFWFLADLQRGFRGQQRTAARLEKALMLYDVGVFDTEPTPIYPAEWKAAGSDQGGGQFFRSTYLLLYVGLVMLVGATLLNGVSHSPLPSSAGGSSEKPVFVKIIGADQNLLRKPAPEKK